MFMLAKSRRTGGTENRWCRSRWLSLHHRDAQACMQYFENGIAADVNAVGARALSSKRSRRPHRAKFKRFLYFNRCASQNPHALDLCPGFKKQIILTVDRGGCALHKYTFRIKDAVDSRSGSPIAGDACKVPVPRMGRSMIQTGTRV